MLRRNSDTTGKFGAQNRRARKLIELKIEALLAARRDPKEWGDIFDWTTGLVFFGTPFRGALGMKQVELLEAARLKYSTEEIQGETLRILQSGNETLVNLVNEFCQLRRQGTKVRCFYELKETAVGKLFGRQDLTVRRIEGLIEA